MYLSSYCCSLRLSKSPGDSCFSYLTPKDISYLVYVVVTCLFRGGIQSILGKPELQKVMQRRKADADGKVGSIRPPERNGVTQAGGSCPDNELATQLARRSQLVQTVGLLHM